MASKEPSDWVVQHSEASRTWPEEEGVAPRQQIASSLGAYLLAPESDPLSNPETGARRAARPSNLDVSANWSDLGPGMFTRPNEGPSETPEQWENDQARLFMPPVHRPPEIDWMRSTPDASSRVATSLGILQNEADQRGLGPLSEGDAPDLSAHSSHLVGKLTGREHDVSNQMNHYGTHDRPVLDMPREGEGGEFTRPNSYGFEHTKVLSKDEANMGLSRFRVALAQSPAGQERAARRASRKRPQGPTYEQGELFPDQ